jgi:hypothetical protein
LLGSIVSGPEVRQDITAGSAGWNKATHLMTTGKQKVRERDGSGDKIYPSKAHPNDPLPSIKPCVLRFLSPLNNPLW